MTENTKHPVSALFSLDGTYVGVASDDQLVDLDLTYAESRKTGMDDVIDGLESYLKFQTLPGHLAHRLKLPNASTWDPDNSRRNAIMGGESFLVTVRDGFIKFVKMIIEYVKQGVAWIIQRVKVFAGFAKSEERIKAAESVRSDIQSELVRIMAKLGAPYSEEELLTLFDRQPEGLNRVETITYLQTSLKGLDGALTGLTEVYPKLQPVVRAVNDRSRNLTAKFKRVNAEIDALKRKTQRGALTNDDVRDLLGEFRSLDNETLGLERLLKDLIEITQDFYGIQWDGVPLNQIGLKLKSLIAQQRNITAQRMNPEAVRENYRLISSFTKKRFEGNAVGISVPSIEGSELKDLVRLNEAETLKQIAEAMGNPAILDGYLRTCATVRDFIQYTDTLISVLNDIQRQTETLVGWKQRVDGYLAVCATNDLLLMRDHYAQSKAAGIDLSVDTQGKRIPMTLVNNKSSDSLLDATGVVIRTALDNDVDKLATRVNAFSRQVGLGIKVGGQS